MINTEPTKMVCGHIVSDVRYMCLKCREQLQRERDKYRQAIDDALLKLPKISGEQDPRGAWEILSEAIKDD